MPIYEYECENCGYRFERLQKIDAAPLIECPECKQPTLRKLISAAGFKLKGSGWYETDFKNKAKTGKKEPEKKPEKTEPVCPATGKKCNGCSGG